MAVQVIASSYTDGPVLTAAAAASCLPTYVPTTLPAGYWQIGRMWRLRAGARAGHVGRRNPGARAGGDACAFPPRCKRDASV